MMGETIARYRVPKTLGRIRAKLALCLLILLPTAALLWAGDPWKDKPYTKWTRKEVEKLLRDSPWSHTQSDAKLYAVEGSQGCLQTLSAIECKQWKGSNPADSQYPIRSDQRVVRQGYPGNSPTESITLVKPGQVSVVWVVRWVSALTLRQALVRQWQLEGIADEKHDRRFLSLQLDYYVISIRPVPLLLWGNPARNKPESAYLELEPSKRKIPAASARLVRKGESPVAVDFYFPRQWAGEPVIGPQVKRVKFRYQLGELEITSDFDLRQMIRNGKPDL